WFALTRRHADMVVADTNVYDAFLSNHAMVSPPSASAPSHASPCTPLPCTPLPCMPL
ncbi:unnamed protein product, partial [Closterium sp. NIES-54]